MVALALQFADLIKTRFIDSSSYCWTFIAVVCMFNTNMSTGVTSKSQCMILRVCVLERDHFPVSACVTPSLWSCNSFSIHIARLESFHTCFEPFTFRPRFGSGGFTVLDYDDARLFSYEC